MKDEEMAEEYANNIDYTKTVKIFDCVPYHENCDVADMVAQAFLAGLKAGRPQWHKIADGDLPKIGKPCFIYLANDYVIIAKLREDNVWTTNGHNAFENVIAWFEIPTFDKE